MAPQSPRFCVLAERQVGIGAAAAAIEPHFRRAGHAWFDVTYVKQGGDWLQCLPWGGRTAGTLRGVLQVREALRAGPYAGLLFLTQNPAVFHPHVLARTPTLVWTDVTPRLLDQHAEDYGHPRGSNGKVEALKHALVRHTFRAAARCVAWSSWAYHSMVHDYDVSTQRGRIIPPGIDLSSWTLGHRPDVGGGLPRLLFVGGDFARKGGHTLLEVFRARLRGRAELDIVTRDPVEEEPGVRVHRGLAPASPALIRLYHAASVFVLPTRADCYSMAALEAMATGLPVVIGNVGGISDIVEEGRCGNLVSHSDARALAGALEALIDDPARRLAYGRTGRAIVERRFDAATAARALMEELSAAVAHEPNRPAKREEVGQAASAS
jgi:glycosyltransferase involved in cell wall biosynthesis